MLMKLGVILHRTSQGMYRIKEFGSPRRGADTENHRKNTTGKYGRFRIHPFTHAPSATLESHL